MAIGSALFDGTGDYLSVPDHEDWNWGTGNITIDLWAKWNGTNTFAQLMCQPVDSNSFWTLQHRSGDNKLYFYCYNVGVEIMLMSSTAVTPQSDGNWHHIAVVRFGSEWDIYYDGVSIASTTDSTAMPNLAAPLYIGSDNGELLLSGAGFNGWIDEIRISKDTARWETNFTPPTSQYTSDSNTKLLLHCNGTDGSTTFTDSSGSAHTVTANGNAQIDTAQYKFGDPPSSHRMFMMF